MDYTKKYLKYKDKYLKRKYAGVLIPVEMPQLLPLLPINRLKSVKPLNNNSVDNSKKIIVKKFNSVTGAQYYKITEFKMNILIFHTVHDYEPQNSSYCGPCTDGCYDIIDFVNTISTNKCIDIFHELDFTDQKLKSLDVIPNLINDIPQPNKKRVLKALEFQLNSIETKLESQDILVNSITLVEEVKKEGIIVDDKLLNQLVGTYLGLIPQEDFLNQYTKNSLIDIIEQFGQNMVENRLTKAFLNNKKTNVRLHSWDTRKLYIKYTKTINILFFFPDLYKLNNDILPTDNTFFDYQIEFNETLHVMLNGFYNKTNSIHPAMLIFYLAGDPELSYKGKIVYDTLFQVFKKILSRMESISVG